MTTTRPPRDWHDLTLGQLDFWQEACAHPGKSVSTVAHVTRLTGVLNRDAFTKAVNRVAAEAEVLSLRFRTCNDGIVRQTVDPAQTPKLRHIDLRQETDPEATALHMMQEDIDLALDLTRDPLSAQWLIQLGAREWLWYCRGHHIFLDGYSMSLIEGRVARLYNAGLSGGDSGPSFLPFADYLQEENRYRAGPCHARDGEFWRNYLDGATDLQVLRKGDEDYPQHPYESCIELAHLVPALRQMAEHLRLGWPDLLTLLSGIWLWSCPGEDRRSPRQPQTIWLPFMGRMGSVSASIPAMVVNILPFRVDVSGSRSLSDQLAIMAEDLRRCRRHGRYRIEQMTSDRRIGEAKRFFFSPLVNVLPFETSELSGCRTERRVLAAGPGDGFNVSFSARNDGSGLALIIEADPALTSAMLFARQVEEFPRFLDNALRQVSERSVDELCACLQPC